MTISRNADKIGEILDLPIAGYTVRGGGGRYEVEVEYVLRKAGTRSIYVLGSPDRKAVPHFEIEEVFEVHHFGSNHEVNAFIQNLKDACDARNGPAPPMPEPTPSVVDWLWDNEVPM